LATHDGPTGLTPTSRSDQKDLSRFRYRLGRFFNFDSVRGRYLLGSGLLISFIVVAGWIGQRIVTDGEQRTTLGHSERKEIGGLLNDLSNDIWLTETTLQGYLLSPHKSGRQATLASIDHLADDVRRLAGTSWSTTVQVRKERISQLASQIEALRNESDNLMMIRADAEKMFPAMRHMIEKMLPRHELFLSLAAQAMDESEEFKDNAAQIEIFKLFGQARHAWVLKISAFRMFVANRFGVFPGDPEEGMRGQQNQIMFYQDMLATAIGKLEKYAEAGQLEFQQQEAFEKIREINTDWQSGYQIAASIYNSDRWRTDIPLLRDTIRPLFSLIWLNLSVLQGELEGSLAREIVSMSGTADQLSASLWIILLVTIILTAAGYVFFDRAIHRPIAIVIEALKAEARGQATTLATATATAETRQLISTFDEMRAQVRSRQLRLQTILDNVAEGIITFNASGTIEGFNLAARKLFGWDERDIAGRPISALADPGVGPLAADTFGSRLLRGEFDSLVGREGEIMGLRKGGSTFSMEMKITGLELGGRRLYVALVDDISERKSMVEHLRNLAEHDDLTGLYNRSVFLQELERVVERSKRHPQLATLLYIDLDNFKYVNDTLGHIAGDRLLIEVGQLLKGRARRGDLIARLGGDEFTVLLYDTNAEESAILAEAFRRALAEFRFRHGGDQIHLGCSIGVAVIAGSDHTAQEILSRADFACHLAKREGRNRVHVFESKDEQDVAELSLDMGWTRRIKEAIDQNRLVLVRQPIMSTRRRDVASYEVLVRLRDEQGNLLLPAAFLSTAERFGLATEIDRWVIVNAIRALSRHRQTTPAIRYGINLSGHTLSQPDIADFIINELQRTGLAPSAVVFEVTETTAITDMDVAVSFLSRLKSIGCGTALDDFGSGMSSFAYLHELPVDYVKIDGRFVRNIADNVMDQAMVRAMNDIAHALGKTTIAEFVENETSLQMLDQYGVDYVQGLYIGKPEIIGDNGTSQDTGDQKVIFLRPR